MLGQRPSMNEAGLYLVLNTVVSWYFSVVDVVRVLTEQPTQRGAGNYWAKLKQRLKAEGTDQLLKNGQQLKLKSSGDITSFSIALRG
jgi:hypothetical protein